MVMEVREEQLLNALFPMLVKEFGRVAEVRLLQPENALFSMRVTPSGITKSVTNTSLMYKLLEQVIGLEPYKPN